MNKPKIKSGDFIRTTVHEPEYFTLGQRGECCAILEDEQAVGGYAYFIEFGEGVFWYLEADEFEVEQ